MKTKKTLLFGLLVGVMCVLWLYFHRPAKQAKTIEPAFAETNRIQDARLPGRENRLRQLSNITMNSTAPTPETDPSAWIESRRKQIEEEIQSGINQWRTPIKFYGIVVDENTNAVSDVSVEFSCNDISSTGTSYYKTKSDMNGLFSLSGVQGKLLVVHLSKAGFYTSKKDNDSFEYGDRYNHFIPDRSNPIVFHLRKKGIAEPLVVYEKNFQISIGGTPLEIDLITGNTMPPGQGSLIAVFVKQSTQNPDGRPYDWSCKFTVPNGGLVLTTNEFNFMAPPNGYEPSDLIETMSLLRESWQGRMKRQYFIKLQGAKYARVTFDLMPHNGSLKIQAFINPSGSRNLEYDPKAQ